MAESLAALPAAALLRAGADASGSRALEAFFAGAAPAKAKRRVLKRLLGGIGALAAEPGGSHVVQAAYASAVRAMFFAHICATDAVREPVAQQEI